MPALEKYEEETRAVLRTFLSRLDDLQGTPVNTTLYAKLIPFDNMGRVGYGRDFGTIRDGREDRMLDLIEFTFKLAARLGQTPWPIVLLARLPRTGMAKEFEELGNRLVDERIAVSFLPDAARGKEPAEGRNWTPWTELFGVLLGRLGRKA